MELIYDEKRKEIRADNILIPFILIESEESEDEDNPMNDSAKCILCNVELVRSRVSRFEFTNHTLEDCIKNIVILGTLKDYI